MKNLTILDNIVLPAVESRKSKESREEKQARGEQLMRKLGIIEIADNDMNEVSGGQLQRACICRSMMNRPRLLFADEPTGALNRTSSNEVMDELVKLNGEGTTIVMVTHDAKVAAKCGRSSLYCRRQYQRGVYQFEKYYRRKGTGKRTE